MNEILRKKTKQQMEKEYWDKKREEYQAKWGNKPKRKPPKHVREALQRLIDRPVPPQVGPYLSKKTDKEWIVEYLSKKYA